MINFDNFKEQYARATGIVMFTEEGELLKFYRESNEVKMPVCGVWHINPIPLTAVNKPFCGIATVDIIVLSHPTIWENTRDTMNEYAEEHNGTSQQYSIDGSMYSVSINAQTCSVGTRILDVGIGYGEVYEIRQQISYIIVKSGVSSYDATLTIDGLQIPFLSLVENKVHTTSNIATQTGEVKTLSECEVYGIDFVIPYMMDETGALVRDVIDRATGNEAHCVVLDIAGEKHCRIMQFAHVSANVQPPQNIGMNVSMTELAPSAAKYNRMWEKEESTGYVASVNLTARDNAESFVIFWGDGCAEYCEISDTPFHIYADNGAHEIIIYKKPRNYYLSIEDGKNYFGKNIYFRFAKNLRYMSVEDFKKACEIEEDTVHLFGNFDENSHLLFFNNRLCFTYAGVSVYYIDTEIDGKHYILNNQKVQCLVDNVAYINGDAAAYIVTSVWD